MERKGLYQEGLKLIACVTMLLDHIGASLVQSMYLSAHWAVLYDLYWLLRTVGRLSFPIYCFLLAEGAARTRDPKKYALRLALGAVLAEVPFDLLFYGGLTWEHQSVMVTLLLGYLMILVLKTAKTSGGKMLLIVPFALAAELLGTDYGGFSALVIGLFALTRERGDRILLQTLGQLLLWWLMGSAAVPIGPVEVPVQLFAVLSMIPIALYSGRKRTASRAVQRGFYLFYPVHLVVLLGIGTLIG